MLTTKALTLTPRSTLLFLTWANSQEAVTIQNTSWLIIKNNAVFAYGASNMQSLIAGLRKMSMLAVALPTDPISMIHFNFHDKEGVTYPWAIMEGETVILSGKNFVDLAKHMLFAFQQAE